MPEQHRLAHIEPYVGRVSSHYQAFCSCGFITDDRSTEQAAKERWREHASGELDRPRPQTNMVSPRDGW